MAGAGELGLLRRPTAGDSSGITHKLVLQGCWQREGPVRPSWPGCAQGNASPCTLALWTVYPVLATGSSKGWPVRGPTEYNLGAFCGTLTGQAIVQDTQFQVCTSLGSLAGGRARTVDNLTCLLVTKVTESELLLLWPQLEAGGEQTLSASCAGHLNVSFQQPNVMYHHCPHFTDSITEAHEGSSNVPKVTSLVIDRAGMQTFLDLLAKLSLPSTLSLPRKCYHVV